MDFTVGIVSRNLASTSNSEIVGVGTFFEASQFGCRKTIFDATKVTYNTYSCAISGMSREMMKMDGQGSVECQNWEKRDIDIILGILKLEKDKKRNSVVSYNSKRRPKTWERGENGQELPVAKNGGF